MSPGKAEDEARRSPCYDGAVDARAAGIFLLALSACGGVEASALRPPVYLWEQSLGPCGAEVAMDGDGMSWREGGCENGAKRFSKYRPFSDLEQREVRRAFDALPPPDGKRCDWSDRFALRATDGTIKEWKVCERDGDHPNPLEIEGLPPPFDGVARALKR